MRRTWPSYSDEFRVFLKTENCECVFNCFFFQNSELWFRIDPVHLNVDKTQLCDSVSWNKSRTLMKQKSNAVPGAVWAQQWSFFATSFIFLAVCALQLLISRFHACLNVLSELVNGAIIDAFRKLSESWETTFSETWKVEQLQRDNLFRFCVLNLSRIDPNDPQFLLSRKTLNSSE